MDQLTNEQLDLCARVLAQMERLGPEHFNMAWWGGADVDHGWREPGHVEYALSHLLDHGLDVTHCGTTACLAGHALLLLDERERAEVETVVDDRAHSWTINDVLRDQIAVRLGMDVNRPSQTYLSAWFMTDWPAWARAKYDHAVLRHETADQTFEQLEALAEYDVVRDTLDELVHGLRFDWWTPLDAEPTDDSIEYIDRSW